MSDRDPRADSAWAAYVQAVDAAEAAFERAELLHDKAIEEERAAYDKGIPVTRAERRSGQDRRRRSVPVKVERRGAYDPLEHGDAA